MEPLGILLGTLLLIAGISNNGLLIDFFSWRNPFLELFGRKSFRKGCVVVGIFLIVVALIGLATK